MTAESVPLEAWAGALIDVGGIEGVMLGGSRARGTHHPGSDVDLGLYYRGRPDTDQLRALAAEWCGAPVDVTEPGAWGPWVDGGAWLVVDGIHVDWIYRDLDRVHAAWADSCAGRVTQHHQAGHPFGFVNAAYVGEVAVGRIFADPTGQLLHLQRAAAEYPPSLREAIVAWLWDADFSIDIATKAVARTDTAYVAGCLFRAVVTCAHVLSADAGRWVVNEKGAVAQAGSLPHAPSGFGERAQGVLGSLGTSAASLDSALASARELVADTRSAVAR